MTLRECLEFVIKNGKDRWLFKRAQYAFPCDCDSKFLADDVLADDWDLMGPYGES